MALHFTDKKKRWPPSKPVQYVLACLLLVLGLFILGGWLFIRFVYTEPSPDDTPHDSPSFVEEDLLDTIYCLVIVEDSGYEHFSLVKTAPKENTVSVTPLSPMLMTSNGELYTLVKKYGPAQTSQTVAQQLGIPSLHYISFSLSDTENFFTRLGENLQFKIAEDISYKDENGAVIHLNKGIHKLTPNQITALLRYTQWENADNRTQLGANIVASVINQCLIPNKSLKGYFELISNTSTTDLRIDQFNAYRNSLEHLAESNNGSLAQLESVID